MLVLVGAGLDKGDISVKGLECLKTADIILFEFYTVSVNEEYKKWLSDASGKKITEIKRSDLEENVKKTISPAKTKTVAIIVPGDPLIATTHHVILDAAHAAGIETKVLHSSSIFTAAIGESGLDLYRFGPTTSIAFWSEHYKPTSFLDVINANMRNNQHTMVLLDIEAKMSRPMTLMEAIKLLVEAEDEKHYNLIRPELGILVIGDMGKEGQLIIYTSIGKIKEITSKFYGKVITLIIPATLNFAEKDAISRHLTTN